VKLTKQFELGIKISLSAIQIKELIKKIQDGYWHDLGHRLPDDVYNQDQISIFYNKYDFYQQGDHLFARDNNHQIIGFLLGFF